MPRFWPQLAYWKTRAHRKLGKRHFPRKLTLENRKRHGDLADKPRQVAVLYYEYPRHSSGRHVREMFAMQLSAKQQLREAYFIASEREFRRYYKRLNHRRPEHGRRQDRITRWVGMLESRLDTAVYRFGGVSTFREARRMIKLGRVNINGLPEKHIRHELREGDEVSFNFGPGFTMETMRENVRTRLRNQSLTKELPHMYRDFVYMTFKWRHAVQGEHDLDYGRMYGYYKKTRVPEEQEPLGDLRYVNMYRSINHAFRWYKGSHH